MKKTIGKFVGCPVIKACWMSATFSCLFFPLLASWPFLCCCTAGDQQQKEISDIPRSQHPYLLVFLQRTLGFRLLCACVRVCSWFWPQNFYQEIIAFHLRFIVVLPVIEKKKFFFLLHSICPHWLLLNGETNTWKKWNVSCPF